MHLNLPVLAGYHYQLSKPNAKPKLEKYHMVSRAAQLWPQSNAFVCKWATTTLANRLHAPFTPCLPLWAAWVCPYESCGPMRVLALFALFYCCLSCLICILHSFVLFSSYFRLQIAFAGPQWVWYVTRATEISIGKWLLSQGRKLSMIYDQHKIKVGNSFQNG